MTKRVRLDDGQVTKEDYLDSIDDRESEPVTFKSIFMNNCLIGRLC